VAVDLACGEGRNALWLARLGWRVLGIDYSPVAIERATALTARQPYDVGLRLSWQVGDVRTLSLTEESVDLALVSYVHLPPEQRASLMLKAVRAVRSQGRLIVVGHDRRNLREGVSGPQDETLLYDPTELKAMLAALGDVSVEFAATVERPTADGVALDTLVRARRT
ncbi:MAG: class I SAM-dependent methyltransferase, partial [Nocardioidaceae bacterium]